MKRIIDRTNYDKEVAYSKPYQHGAISVYYGCFLLLLFLSIANASFKYKTNSSGGEQSWIQADLGRTPLVYGFEIRWLKGRSDGSGTINHFEVALFNNGAKPGRFMRLASTGSREEIYYVDEPEPPEARYIRLRFGQNQDNNRFDVVSLKILGKNRSKRTRIQ